jgi:UDP-3-O-[3-hydroxymyristoyl] glucosamine N-acyltransferase
MRSNARQKLPKTIIPRSANVHSCAIIADTGVTIGENCTIGPEVVILSNSKIGDYVQIGPGAVIGSEGFMCLKRRRKIVPIPGHGGVVIAEGSIIGCHTCIDCAHERGQTIIGKQTRLGERIHVAHDVQIGDHCYIGSGAMLAGFVKIEKNSKIYARANIVERLTIGEGATILDGAVVTKEVSKFTTMAGNFAFEAQKHEDRMLLMKGQGKGIE